MTSADYREQARKLLTTRTIGGELPEQAIEQAAVWAQLATAAAIEEQARAVAADARPLLHTR